MNDNPIGYVSEYDWLPISDLKIKFERTRIGAIAKAEMLHSVDRRARGFSDRKWVFERVPKGTPWEEKALKKLLEEEPETLGHKAWLSWHHFKEWCKDFLDETLMFAEEDSMSFEDTYELFKVLPAEDVDERKRLFDLLRRKASTDGESFFVDQLLKKEYDRIA